MIELDDLKTKVDSLLAGTGYFPVEVTVSPAKVIDVEIDSIKPVDIDFCADLSRKIAALYGDEIDDYDLSVGSAGLTSPFKVRAQYLKNIGNPVEVLASDGKKYKGTLKEVGDTGFVVEITAREKPEGAKKPQLVTRDVPFDFDKVKYTKYLLQF